MCRASLHLLIGVLFVLAVQNEATTTTENMTTSAYTSEDISTIETTHIDNNFTSSSVPPNSNTQSNTTDTTNSTEDSTDSPTPPPSPQNPQTNSNTTEAPAKTVPQTTAKNKITITTSKATQKTTTVQSTASTKKNEPTYIVIIVVIIMFLIGIAVYCCCQKKNRNYSVELHPKREDAQIPLSTVDAEVFDTTSEKDLQTFTAVQSAEPVKEPDAGKEAEKPGQGKETVDVKQENQQNASSVQATEISKDKPEELTVVDLTDGDQAISTKTSMESLDDVLNENNSNNTTVEVP